MASSGSMHYELTLIVDYMLYTVKKWSSTHELGGVNGVASLKTIDEQLQLN